MGGSVQGELPEADRYVRNHLKDEAWKAGKDTVGRWNRRDKGLVWGIERECGRPRAGGTQGRCPGL